MLKVDTACMENQAAVLRMLSARLDDISQDVSSVNQNLRWNVKVNVAVRSSLLSQKGSIAQLDEKAKRLAVLLSEIASEYSKTEKKCKTCDWTPEAHASGPDGSDDKAKYDEILKNLVEAIIGKPQCLLPGVIGTIGMLDVLWTVVSDGDPNSGADRTWLGYELHEDGNGFTLWGGKTGASAETDWGHAGVNGYLGKVEAKKDADFSFMETKIKKEKKDGKWEEKEVTSFVNAEVGASASVNILSGDAEAGVGDDMLGVEGEGEVSVGNAKGEAEGKFSISEEGVDAYAKGEAMVSAVEGEAKVSFNVLGFEVTAKIGGYAGAVGAEGKIGIEDNKFVMDGGLAAVIGVSGGIEVGFNDEGWDNFVDFVTFWD